MASLGMPIGWRAPEDDTKQEQGIVEALTKRAVRCAAMITDIASDPDLSVTGRSTKKPHPDQLEDRAEVLKKHIKNELRELRDETTLEDGVPIKQHHNMVRVVNNLHKCGYPHELAITAIIGDAMLGIAAMPTHGAQARELMERLEVLEKEWKAAHRIHLQNVVDFLEGKGVIHAGLVHVPLGAIESDFKDEDTTSSQKL